MTWVWPLLRSQQARNPNRSDSARLRPRQKRPVRRDLDTAVSPPPALSAHGDLPKTGPTLFEHSNHLNASCTSSNRPPADTHAHARAAGEHSDTQTRPESRLPELRCDIATFRNPQPGAVHRRASEGTTSSRETVRRSRRTEVPCRAARPRVTSQAQPARERPREGPRTRGGEVASQSAAETRPTGECPPAREGPASQDGESQASPLRPPRGFGPEPVDGADAARPLRSQGQSAWGTMRKDRRKHNSLQNVSELSLCCWAPVSVRGRAQPGRWAQGLSVDPAPRGDQ